MFNEAGDITWRANASSVKGLPSNVRNANQALMSVVIDARLFVVDHWNQPGAPPR